MARKKAPASKEKCECAFCKSKKPFALDEHLVERIKAGDVVLFAGAGISTENPAYCKSTFYEEMRALLRAPDNISFPELMTELCSGPDGRLRLIEQIKNRLQYFISFQNFYRPMTKFHRAISPLYMIQDIVTTNWDDFFERECGIDAFIYDGDIALWDASARRLMKIHGSISNFGSIIATVDDYTKSYERLNDGPLGAHLKSLMARKTIVYAGYSLSDPNYLRLLNNISRMMEGNVRQSYFISPEIDDAKLAAAPVRLAPIKTDAAYFFEEMRKHLSTNGEIIEDETFDMCGFFLSNVAEKHSKTADVFLQTHHPLLIFALSYQDGLIHALQRIETQRKTGEYHSHNRVHSLVHGYEHKLDGFLAKKDFWNASYALGYQAGLLTLLVNDRRAKPDYPPIFDFPFRVKANSLAAIKRLSVTKIPKPVRQQANRILKRVGEDLIPDHTPYL